jgi:hypothetical protein
VCCKFVQMALVWSPTVDIARRNVRSLQATTALIAGDRLLSLSVACEVVRRLRDDDGDLSALSDLQTLLSRMELFAEALQVCDELQAILQRRGKESARLLIDHFVNKSILPQTMERQADAVLCCERALSILRRLKDQECIATSVNVLGCAMRRA